MSDKLPARQASLLGPDGREVLLNSVEDHGSDFHLSATLRTLLTQPAIVLVGLSAYAYLVWMMIDLQRCVYFGIPAGLVLEKPSKSVVFGALLFGAVLLYPGLFFGAVVFMLHGRVRPNKLWEWTNVCLGLVAFVFVLVLIFSPMFGAAIARTNTEFMVLAPQARGEPELVVLYSDGEHFICAPFQRQKHETERTFVLLDWSQISQEKRLLQAENIGPLHPAPAPPPSHHAKGQSAMNQDQKQQLLATMAAIIYAGAAKNQLPDDQVTPAAHAAVRAARMVLRERIQSLNGTPDLLAKP